MGQYCCGSVIFKAGLHDFAGMNFGAVDGSFKKRFVSNQAVLVIQPEKGELFTLQQGQVQA